jgi:hypothetical protein
MRTNPLFCPFSHDRNCDSHFVLQRSITTHSKFSMKFSKVNPLLILLVNISFIAADDFPPECEDEARNLVTCGFANNCQTLVESGSGCDYTDLIVDVSLNCDQSDCTCINDKCTNFLDRCCPDCGQAFENLIQCLADAQGTSTCDFECGSGGGEENGGGGNTNGGSSSSVRSIVGSSSLLMWIAGLVFSL